MASSPGEMRPVMDKSASKGLMPGPSTGTVKSYNSRRAPFGGTIVDARTGLDVFVHKSAVAAAGLEPLKPSQQLAFVVVEDGFGGFKADQLRLIE